jgi:hypothetical protein
MYIDAKAAVSAKANSHAPTGHTYNKPFPALSENQSEGGEGDGKGKGTTIELTSIYNNTTLGYIYHKLLPALFLSLD